jgi:DNA-binding MarR family transcriptional regulator
MSNKINLPLTKREEEIFVYILGYIVDNEYSPTRREIAERFDMGISGADKFVSSLVDKGKLKLIKKRNGIVNRNIVIK